VIVSRYLTDFSSFIPLLTLSSFIAWQEISILLRLSNPNLGKPDVTFRIYELNKKAGGDNSKRRLNPKLGNPDVINRLNELINKAAGENSRRRLNLI
jgi:hypothetical protein